MKTVISFILPLFLILHVNVKAQEVIASGGDYFSNSYGSLSITLGEPVVETFLGTSKILTQGFQQTKMDVVNIEDLQDSKIEIEVFPNPTNNLLNIQVKNADDLKIRCKLYNSEGKLLLRHDSNLQEFNISMSQFESGSYYLRVSTNHKKLNALKIIKN